MHSPSKIALLSLTGLLLSGVAVLPTALGSFAEGQPLAMTTSSIAPPTKMPVVTKESITFGAYDPHGDLGASPNSKIEHLFLPWEDVDLRTLALADDYAQARGRTLLISVEPWTWSTGSRQTSQELLHSILNGSRDANMAAVCSTAAKLKSPVIIRWGQEWTKPTASSPGRIGRAPIMPRPIAGWWRSARST